MIEIKQKRDHFCKHYQKDNGEFICRQSLTLAHYFNGETFEEIENIPFPEGKEINSEKDLEMITIPKWAEVELAEDKKIAWFKDKKGVRIQEFTEALLALKNIPYSIEKGKVIIDKDKTVKTNFCVKNGSLSFELPKGMEAKDLRAFDDTDVGSTNNKDCTLQQENPNNNYNDGFPSIIGGYTNRAYRFLINFTLSSGTATISSVKFYNYAAYKYGNETLQVHSLTRTNWTETGATWNKYDGTNNWTTAGGDYDGTAIDAVYVTAVGWVAWTLMGADADNPLILNWGDSVNLLFRATTEGGGAYTGYDVKSKESATNKPYIEITYSGTNIKSINGLASASVKSINGLASASVKSINGLE